VRPHGTADGVIRPRRRRRTWLPFRAGSDYLPTCRIGPFDGHILPLVLFLAWLFPDIPTFSVGPEAEGPADNKRVSATQGTDRRGPMSGWGQVRSRVIGPQDKDEPKSACEPYNDAEMNPAFDSQMLKTM
jgi:hypothetical protein